MDAFCPICRKQLSVTSINRHLQEVHGDQSTRKAPCQWCKRSFNKNYLNTHKNKCNQRRALQWKTLKETTMFHHNQNNFTFNKNAQKYINLRQKAESKIFQQGVELVQAVYQEGKVKSPQNQKRFDPIQIENRSNFQSTSKNIEIPRQKLKSLLEKMILLIGEELGSNKQKLN